MRRLDFLAALVAVAALVFLACSDNPERGIPQTGGTSTTAVVKSDAHNLHSAATSTSAVSTTTTEPEVVVPAPPVEFEPTTTTTTAPPPTVAAASSDMEALIHDYFPGEGAYAVRVFRCESNLNPNAVSPTNDHGVAQIHAGSASFPGGWVSTFEQVTGHPFYNGVYDPALNLQFAAWLRAESGWGAWACA